MEFWKVKHIKNLGLILAIFSGASLAVAPLEARTRKGDKFFKQAQKAETNKQWDSAVELYDRALATDPQDANYLLWDQRIHSKASLAYLSKGRSLQKEQKLDRALAMFQKAFLADPSSQAALAEIRSTTTMIREHNRNPNAPTYTPAEQARRDIEKRISSLEGPPVLKPITAEISSLKVNNQPARVLYESVCKLAGINLLTDPSGLDTPGGLNRNFNIDLNNVTLEEALNYIALMTHTFWKPISRNAIFVTQEGEQKRQEYQDEVVKVFYIQSASTPNEFTEIFNGVRTGAKLTSNVFQVASQSAIIARGSPDTISIVEKLVHDLDTPKAEVTMDVLILAVNKNKLQTIGAAILGQNGLSVPLNFTPRNLTPGSTTPGSNPNGGTTPTPSATTQQFTLAQLGHLSTADYSTTLPSTIVTALLNDTTTKILQRPQLRATDGGKASLKIGQKVPYVSGSLNSAVATPGSIPYATTQFTQIEVGTLIDLQPHVNGLEDISMHIRVELSNVLQDVQIAGISQPEIGQQIDEADVRMRDGEVSILGGLSDVEKTRSLIGVPGLSNVPGLNYLFGSKKRQDIDSEILIAVIPHISRAPEFNELAGQGIYAGTERVARVGRAHGSSVKVTLPPSATTPGAAPPAGTPPGGNLPIGPQYPPRQNIPQPPPQAPQPRNNTSPPPVGPAPLTEPNQ